MNGRTKKMLLSAGVGLSALVAPGVASAATVVVDENNYQGWTPYLSTSWTTGFELGPAIPPMGLGSGYLANTANGDEPSGLYTALIDGVPLADLISFSYSTRLLPGGDAQAPFIYFDLDPDGDPETADNTDVYFEPAYQQGAVGGNQPALVQGQWQTWTFTLEEGGFGDESFKVGSRNGDVFTLQEFLDVYPDATFADNGGAFGVWQGLSSEGSIWHSNFDAISFDFGGAEPLDVTYDFETIFVPEPASVGLLAAGSLLLVRRKRA